MSGADKGAFERLGGDAAKFYFQTGSLTRARELLIDKHGEDGEVSLHTLHNWKRRGGWRELRDELSALETEDALIAAFTSRVEKMVDMLSGAVDSLRDVLRSKGVSKR